MNESDISKDKYTYVVALLAAILAFTAFKEELSKISVSFGFFQTSLLILIIAFAMIITLSSYFFGLNYLKAGTKYQDTKLLKWIRPTADITYFIGMIIPLVVLVIWCINQIIILLGLAIADTNFELFTTWISSFTAFIAGIFTAYSATKYLGSKEEFMRKKTISEYKNKQEQLFENAERLYRQKFYSSSIVETFKIVELVLREAMMRNGISPERMNFPILIDQAQKKGLIDDQQANLIRDMKGIRNRAAHLTLDLSKKDADFVLDGARPIIKQLDKKNINDIEWV